MVISHKRHTRPLTFSEFHQSMAKLARSNSLLNSSQDRSVTALGIKSEKSDMKSESFGGSFNQKSFRKMSGITGGAFSDSFTFRNSSKNLHTFIDQEGVLVVLAGLF